MAVLLVIMYAFYFVLVGAQGNASAFLSAVSQEKQFLYWFLVLLVVAALWNSPVATNFARAFAILIVVGWMVGNQGRNGKQLFANAQAILPALGGSAATSTPAGATGAAGGLT